MNPASFLPNRLISVITIFIVVVTSALPALSQGRGPSLVRDAEIEALIADYARPLMRVVGLRPGSVEFFLLHDESFNAFVSANGMYLHTGLLLQSKTPNEVIGVIAHELGHIVGGHQLRLRERIDQAKRFATISTLLGLGVGAAGAATGSRELSTAGFGIAGGGSVAAIRDLLAYKRDEEISADRAASRMLRQSRQSGAGMLNTFKRMAEQTAIMAGRIDPYLLTHPMPNQRIRNLEQTLTSSPYFSKSDSAALQLRHDMMRAKIAAYTGQGAYARALLSGKELKPAARLYGRAITTYRYGSPKKALPLIDQSLKGAPNNPFLHEMKGEILLRSGQPAEAAKAFARAVKLDRTNSGFMRVELGHALLETGKRANIEKAIKELNAGLARDPSALVGYQYLARAYGEVGNAPRALLASAELAARTGKKRQAVEYARRAQQSFKHGSPPWLRAEDIISIR